MNYIFSSSHLLHQQTTLSVTYTHIFSQFELYPVMLTNIIFTFISLISASLTLLVTLPLIIIMFNHLRRNRDVVLLLMTNTYMTMFAYASIVFVININVLLADLYGSISVSTSDSSECHFQGFLLCVTFGCCYMSFVLQASYRFTRVVYAKRKIFQVCVSSIVPSNVKEIESFISQCLCSHLRSI